MDDPPVNKDTLSPDATAVVESLRLYAVAFEENLRHLGAWMGVAARDAMALADVSWSDATGEPMSPARLTHRMGVSSGSTTAIIDRLEAGGHLVRSRESTDRRVITLRPSPAARQRIQEFFDTSAGEVRTVLAGFDDDSIRRCSEILAALLAHLNVDNQRRTRA